MMTRRLVGVLFTSVFCFALHAEDGKADEKNVFQTTPLSKEDKQDAKTADAEKSVKAGPYDLNAIAKLACGRRGGYYSSGNCYSGGYSGYSYGYAVPSYGYGYGYAPAPALYGDCGGCPSVTVGPTIYTTPTPSFSGGCAPCGPSTIGGPISPIPQPSMPYNPSPSIPYRGGQPPLVNPSPGYVPPTPPGVILPNPTPQPPTLPTLPPTAVEPIPAPKKSGGTITPPVPVPGTEEGVPTLPKPRPVEPKESSTTLPGSGTRVTSASDSLNWSGGQAPVIPAVATRVAMPYERRSADKFARIELKGLPESARIWVDGRELTAGRSQADRAFKTPELQEKLGQTYTIKADVDGTEFSAVLRDVLPGQTIVKEFKKDFKESK